MTEPHLIRERETDIRGSDAGKGSNGSGTGISIRVVRTADGFDALEPEWNALLEESEAGVFQTFEWLRTWWEYFGEKLELHILVFQSGHRTVGIAPLCLSRKKFVGLTISRHLAFIGAVLSDYLGLVVRKGWESKVTEAFAIHLSENQSGWDVTDFQDVNEHVSWFPDLQPSLLRAGLPVYRYQGNVCPVFNLPASVDSIYDQLGPSTSYNMKRKVKKLETQFRSDLEIITRDTGDIEQAIIDFAHIHGHRWKSQGHPSAFDDPKHRAFHVAICRKFAKRNWLRLFFLRVDDARVAVSINFNYRSRIFMYQCNAHGPEDVMKCSPGMVLRYYVVVDGIGEGMRVFDFLRGNESYKYREWKAVDSRNWLIRTSSRTLTGRVRFFVFLAAEIYEKMYTRVKWEYYEFRRFKLAGGSRGASLRFVGIRLGELASIFSHYVRRHWRVDEGQTGPAKHNGKKS